MCSYVENGFLWAQEADFSDKEAWHTGSPGPNILISSKISYTKIDHVNRKVDVWVIIFIFLLWLYLSEIRGNWYYRTK